LKYQDSTLACYPASFFLSSIPDHQQQYGG